VGVVEEKLPRALLIDEHAPLERAGAHAGEPEVLRHPPGVAPDRAALGGCLPGTMRILNNRPSGRLFFGLSEA